MLYDVAIVGAGPAGSTAAIFLSKKGFKVALIDKSDFPRDKPCGGGLPNHVLKRFSNIIPKDIIESHSYGGTTISPSLKYKIKYTTNKPFTSMILRKKFDNRLVKKAIENGADFKPGKKVNDIKISNDKGTVIFDDNTNISSRIIIGADGVWSTVAKKTGLRKKNTKIGFSVVEEYDVDEDIMDKYFGERRLGYVHSKFQNVTGYGWVFPKKKHLNIGIGVIEYNPRNKEINNLKEIYSNYLSILKKQKLIPGNIEIKKIKGGALPVYPLKKTYSNRVLLIGDAGGFINPTSGEGIYYAMASAEIAAETIGESLNCKDTSEKFLLNYQKKWKKDFGKELRLLYWVSKIQKKSKNSEKNLILLYKDEKLRQLLMESMAGNLDIHQYKWKILRRFIYDSIKYKLGKF